MKNYQNFYCLTVCWSDCLFVWLSICLFVCRSVLFALCCLFCLVYCKPASDLVWLFCRCVCSSAYKIVCLSICMSVCLTYLWTYLVKTLLGNLIVEGLFVEGSLSKLLLNFWSVCPSVCAWPSYFQKIRFCPLFNNFLAHFPNILGRSSTFHQKFIIHEIMRRKTKETNYFQQFFMTQDWSRSIFVEDFFFSLLQTKNFCLA